MQIDVMTNTNPSQIDPQVKINVEDRCSFSVVNWLRNDLKSCDILACPAPPGLVVLCHDLQNCPLLVACRCKKELPQYWYSFESRATLLDPKCRCLPVVTVRCKSTVLL